jgi:hypothetical protein
MARDVQVLEHEFLILLLNELYLHLPSKCFTLEIKSSIPKGFTR